MQAHLFVMVWLVTVQGEHQFSDEEDIDSAEGSGKGVSPITCYRCTLTTPRGCDGYAMSKNKEQFTVQCSGHCLNLTAGIHASYDCTENKGQSNYCIENEGTKICVCNSNYCNGPPSVYHEQDIDFELSTPIPPSGGADNSQKSAHEKVLVQLGNSAHELPKSEEYWEVTTDPNSCSVYSRLHTFILFSIAFMCIGFL